MRLRLASHQFDSCLRLRFLPTSFGRRDSPRFSDQRHSVSIAAEEINVAGEVLHQAVLCFSRSQNKPFDVARQHLLCFRGFGIKRRLEIQCFRGNKVSDRFKGKRNIEGLICQHHLLVDALDLSFYGRQLLEQGRGVSHLCNRLTEIIRPHF